MNATGERNRPEPQESVRRDFCDAALTGGLGMPIVVLTGSWWPGLDGGVIWWHLLPILLICCGEFVRRTRPWVSSGIGLAALTLDALLGGSAAIIVVAVDLLYNATLFGSLALRRVAIGAAVAATVAVAVLSAQGGEVSGTARGREVVLAVLYMVAVLGTPLAWATNVRQRNEIAALAEQRLALERERTADLQRIARLDLQEAVAAERRRMAADLHDAIASRLAAVAMMAAGALASSADSDDASRVALRSVRTSSLDALADMRRMIAVLRDPQSGAADAPLTATLARLDGLIGGARTAGLKVRFESRVPDHDVRRIPAAVQQAAFRIVQESITNVLKHGDGAATTVDLSLDGAELVVAVLNGRPHRHPTAHSPINAGTGLAVMRERAERCGGTFEAGESADGGWAVLARLPIAVDAPSAVGRPGEEWRIA